MSEEDEFDEASGRSLSEYYCIPGEPLLRCHPEWKPTDEHELAVPQLVKRIWLRPSYAVAPNGHTCPFVTLEEWTKIYEWFLEQERE